MYKLTAQLKTGALWVFTSQHTHDLIRIAKNLKAIKYTISLHDEIVYSKNI